MLAQALTRRLRPAARYIRFMSTTLLPDPSLNDGERNIFSKLSERFSPSALQVQDISGGCGDFYAISITSQAFKGLSIVKQHRLVNETLKDEIAGIHGLQIKTISQ